MDINDDDSLREKIVGLGSKSYRKNYYSDLQKKIGELNLFNSAIDQASDLVVIFQKSDGKIEYANKSFKNIFYNTENSEIREQELYIRKIAPPALWEQIDLQVNSDSESGKSCRVELDNKAKIFDAIINLIEYRKNAYVVVSLRDITKSAEYEDYIKQQNIELKKAKNRAEESDKLKSIFISNISHEIRTPMNGILGFSGILLEEEINDKLKEIVHHINTSANRLFGIIDNLLEYSIVFSKSINLQLTDVDLFVIADELKQEFNEMAKIKNIEFNFEIPPNLSKQYHTDKELIKKAFSILLDNAFKFTLSGKVTFGCKLIDNEYTLFVSDTGIGIHAHEIDSIFDHFKKGNNDLSTFNDGTGLGLAIVKSFVEATGGWIKVESELNKQTIFTFQMGKFVNSQELISPVQESKPKQNKNRASKILVVEDDVLVFLYISTILKDSQHIIIHAKNGLEATKYYSSNPDVDLILMDIKMPVMNGYEAAEIIRKKNRKVPIIAQSAYPVDLKEHLEFNDIISKPIAKQNLFNALDMYLV